MDFKTFLSFVVSDFIIFNKNKKLMWYTSFINTLNIP